MQHCSVNVEAVKFCMWYYYACRKNCMDSVKTPSRK